MMTITLYQITSYHTWKEILKLCTSYFLILYQESQHLPVFNFGNYFLLVLIILAVLTITDGPSGHHLCHPGVLQHVKNNILFENYPHNFSNLVGRYKVVWSSTRTNSVL